MSAPEGQPAKPAHRGVAAVIAMMGLYFLVLLSLGMLRPIRNTLALDGLGQTDFYKVYLVSALVIVFVPVLNWLSDHVPWKRLIPGVALFLAMNLFVFWSIYSPGSTAFGLVFYGWYDLYAASLVTQLFMATQLFFHARMARYAYPVVIGGGALGASAGGAVTGFLAQTVGTPNLLLVAAVIIGIFGVTVAWVWSLEGMVPERGRSTSSPGPGRDDSGGFGLRAIFSNRQVLLITALVITTIVVKQFVDYQFNTITKEVFTERDAIAAFQGKFGAATQWLPIVVLLCIRKPMERWGVGFVVLVLPVAMLLTNAGLILFWGLWAATAAKGAETSFRYSAERAGREILYVPVPDEIKLKAKAYIDVAVEKGIGKLLSALILFALLSRIEVRQVAWVGAGLSVVWILMALAVRREYIRSLATAVENRFASLRGVHASLGDGSTRRIVRDALLGDTRQAAFALDLLEQASPIDSEALSPELHGLVGHAEAEIRRRSLTLLLRIPSMIQADRIRPHLDDPDAEVRTASVRAYHAAHPGREREVVEELLGTASAATRSAVLACLAEGDLPLGEARIPASLEARLGPDDPLSGSVEERVERALVAAALRPPSAVRIIGGLLQDPEPRVARVAIQSAGRLGDPALYPKLVLALGGTATREAARSALAGQGTAALPVLIESLLDPEFDRRARRHIPSVLARIPEPETVEALTAAILAPETEQVLDFRAMKALSKLRAHHPELEFDSDAVWSLVDRSVEMARLLAVAGDVFQADGSRTAGLLRQALTEARDERIEEVFRGLGLLHDPRTMHQCHAAVTRGKTVPRSNALEWLENTLGFHAFQRISPVLGERQVGSGRASIPTEPEALLTILEGEEDRWIAHCARRTARELARADGDPDRPVPADPSTTGATNMDLIEAVFLLQQVDVLRDARSGHLALLASIAEEVDADRDTILFERGDRADALYVVVRGEVTLSGVGEDLRLTDGQAFGTWALIDDVPSLLEVRVTAPTRLLRIDREDFHDLMNDHPELAIGMLQGLARRVRTLVS